jgi:hypothetical protein
MTGRAIMRSGAWRGAAMMALLLAGCEAPVEPTRFARGQKIPLGSLTITVSHSESVSADYFGGLDPRILKGGPQLLVVLFNAEGSDPQNAQTLIFDLLRMLDVIDDQQKTFGPGVPLPRPTYNMMMTGGSMRTPGDFKTMMGWSSEANRFPTEWACLFVVQEKSRGFSVRLHNLDQQEGQPRLAIVPLGR